MKKFDNNIYKFYATSVFLSFNYILTVLTSEIISLNIIEINIRWFYRQTDFINQW